MIRLFHLVIISEVADERPPRATYSRSPGPGIIRSSRSGGSIERKEVTIVTAHFAVLLCVLLKGGGPQSQPATMPSLGVNMDYSLPEWEPRPKETEPAVDASVLYVADPVYDFGEVWSGEVIDHEFMVTNESLYTVWVRQVMTAAICGVPDVEIGPCETAPIRVRFNTRGTHGEVTKNLVLKIVRTASTRPAE
jgi:hypothetical protein